MFTDARNLPDHTTLEADLAIIGGGIAGITLALALAGSRSRVCVIESGGLDFDPQVQSLYEGENTGISYSTTATRLRFFGGSSNHWGGYCRPLDAIDFEQRDWVPFSGWPFALEELTPWYRSATEIVQVAPGRFDDPLYWQQQTGEIIPMPATGRLRPAVRKTRSRHSISSTTPRRCSSTSPASPFPTTSPSSATSG